MAKLLATLIIPLEPVPASRPRVTRWGTYYAKTYKNWMEAAAEVIPAGVLTADKPTGMDKRTPLVVFVHSISTKARTSKLTYPRYDVDNAAKAVLDAITKAGGWWYDDDQVLQLVSTKRFALKGESAHTEVQICSAT